MSWWTMRQLGSADSARRQRAIEKLIAAGDSRTVAVLLTQLRTGGDDYPRASAAEVVRRLADVQDIPALVAASNVPGLNVAKLLASLVERRGAQAVGPLLNALRSGLRNPDGDARGAVAMALRSLDPDVGVDQFAAVFPSAADSEVRMVIAETLGGFRHPRALDLLIGWLADPDPGVRVAVIQALAAQRGRGAVEPLIARLEDRDAGVREAAITALQQIGDDRAAAPLAAALADPERAVWRAAVAALGFLRDERAVPPLAAMLRAKIRSDSDVVAELESALIHHGGVDTVLAVLLEQGTMDQCIYCARRLLHREQKTREQTSRSSEAAGGQAGEQQVQHWSEPALRLLTRVLEISGSGRAYRDLAFRDIWRIRIPEADRLNEEYRQELERRVLGSDSASVDLLKELCDAYAANDQPAIAQLEPVAAAIGSHLDKSGGLRAMRRVFEKLGEVRGARTLEMHWNGIGEWRG